MEPRRLAARGGDGAGLAAPYTAIRDVGAHAPLDHRPLERALDARPGLRAAVLDAFRPGWSLCETGPVDAALRAGR